MTSFASPLALAEQAKKAIINIKGCGSIVVVGLVNLSGVKTWCILRCWQWLECVKLLGLT
jgi:hypothetical protein